jgi:hypothetical protein
MSMCTVIVIAASVSVIVGELIHGDWCAALNCRCVGVSGASA